MPRGDPRNVIVQVPLTATEHERYRAEATKADMKLAPWLRRCAEESYALQNALELQVADRHREQERRRLSTLEVEHGQPRRQPRRSSPQPVRHGPTVGEALRAADRSAGRRGPML